ncbi:glycoside hydrolase family protein [Alcaligenes aquatilis]|uniref:glycoside hydrolase family protein n=1 Tax=Alcaligenes aquatilis TaxID=323284 RepID=UPI000F65C931|nr:glycoside hydrolase family protein [Alcaligenes aquatilis]QXR37306.1 glycoside hydrolase family protein [Alcaligenes aquatilis]
MSRSRTAIAALTVSLAGVATWIASEGSSPVVSGPDGTVLLAPHIPTKGDVPTIGHGSTRYEDGAKVKLLDPPITRERAVQLARNLMSEDEARFRASLPGVKLHQEEYDLYIDFVGQYGIGRWRSSSMRRHLLAGNYTAACKALLLYKYSSGYDCSTPGNKICYGVWDRQLKRYNACMAAQ